MATDTLRSSIGALERELERNRTVTAKTPGWLADVDRQLAELPRRRERLVAQGDKARRAVDALAGSLAVLRELAGDEEAETEPADGAAAGEKVPPSPSANGRVDRSDNHEKVRRVVVAGAGVPVTLAELEAATRLSRDDVLASVSYLKGHHHIDTPKGKRGVYVPIFTEVVSPTAPAAPAAPERQEDPAAEAGALIAAAMGRATPEQEEIVRELAADAPVDPDDVLDDARALSIVPAEDDDESTGEHPLERQMAEVGRGSELPLG